MGIVYTEPLYRKTRKRLSAPIWTTRIVKCWYVTVTVVTEDNHSVYATMNEHALLHTGEAQWTTKLLVNVVLA